MEEFKKFRGIIDKNIHFTQKYQLMDPGDWDLFVDQFRTNPDDVDLGWRGEYFGKMMRGSCMVYQYTQNQELYKVLTEAAIKLMETQDTEGRISSYSRDAEFQGWDMWCRKYVILGLLHYHEICQDRELKNRIIKVLEKHLDYIVARVGKEIKIEDTSTWWGGINSASILEPVIKLYNITQKESYFEFAKYIIDTLLNGKTNIFTLALESSLYPYQYPVTKAYEMMSCFEGLIEYYKITKEKWCLEAAKNFALKVLESDITVIGCAGCEHELFNHSTATQTDTDYKGIMQETCVTVTWMKFCNRLLEITKDPLLADCIEQSYYNALCGALNTEHCTTNGGFVFDSYSPLTCGTRGRAVGGYKNIAPDRYYGCCAAIGAAGVALPALNAVVADDKEITFNFYESGTVKIGDFEFSIETKYPVDGSIVVTVEKAPEQAAVLTFRIPGFSNAKGKITINGQEKSGLAGGYYSLEDKWKKGDRIELLLDMNPRIVKAPGMEEKPETKEYFAILYGPLVMARDKRITSNVGTAEPLCTQVKVIPKEQNDYDCILRAEVIVGESKMDMIDYGSAGKTWDEESLTEAWIKIR